MMSLSDDKQADVIDAFNTTSRYLDDILNINNVYYDKYVLKRVSFGSKDCTKELILECAYFLGQTS